ncbi:MAG: HAD hydrolase-like protein [FCB group bacterium]|jgi:beta-phosphoglucomutase-like phosphatase (HAD superfamily)|nr:HAD hydrolase-like protein [FCB group bacterium]
MTNTITIPGLGAVSLEQGLVALEACSDGAFCVGRGGVCSVTATGDGKVEFVAFEDRTLAYVKSAMGYPAYYPVHPVRIETPVQAVLMDLDGTSVRSESFWIWIIQLSIASVLGNPRFELEEADLPYVSGHSVSEHLQYCIRKYAPEKTVEDARAFYFEHTRREMRNILEGRGRADAFTPTPGLKDFLYTLKDMGVRIGLVTSGLYEKAWPEIVSAFRTLDMGDPKEFYDAIISAGFPIQKGEVGTLGELSPKPHPWLYAETSRVGLGIPFEDRNRVVGIEDSGAGVCSIRIAGFPVVGISGGNIVESGTQALCEHYCDTFEEILDVLR